ncbi:MAG TPA: YhgE/Pip domain-containing protein, partial [Virgibacillus sp.]|nr:YhgE/Pip domain-containing protein [Virgibacillus sp.]
MKSIFSKESLSIFKDRKLLIAMSAIIFVPILYAGMFLWAFWDPYDFLDDIPVAVVDEDEGYMFEGEFLTLGQELVDNLKDEDAFEFHFVDKEKGYQGLRDQEYYILIEIPEDFSKNATTVMDDTPEQLELIYVPNESYNFLASQMGETAMLQIEQALEEK